ncbi:AMP-binding protein [Herbaspirillum aquaticum]|jgi:acyl-CoA synthetase (AMP-forming)/AMP-acid ligase II|uniref:AMP-dependent synthetase n=1 Tax=Herbaspirillum aquaticum TaxID=568783 RepID=A0A225SUJ5_9BURK|nr:AMP-binding protein [Herbaspirillum aquaticum]OWY34837.1 AMP-dependent synthetase [Herbaspirillum aquaticum]
MFDLIQFGSQPCLEGDGQAYTYAEVQRETERMRAVLPGRHLVLCLCENSLPSLLGYISLVVHDQVPLLIEASLQAPTVQAMAALYRPGYVWLAEARSAEWPGATPVYRSGHYVLLKLAHAEAPPLLDASLQLLLTTSGSTGSSKLVRLSRANLLANAASICTYLDIRAEDVAVTSLPFSYSFGLSIIHTHLLAGASIQVTALTPLNRQFWDLMQQRKVTSLSGVPYTYDMLKRIKFERFDLPALRYLTQAGGKMSASGLTYLQRLSTEKAWPCIVMYGQTEAGPRMAYLPAAWLAHKPQSIGDAIPGGRFELIDVDGKLITAPHVPGELVYYGPNVALGYATGAADLVRGDDWGGRLSTGDVAYRDEEGCYYISGRLKRFVKVFGNRVSFDEVEALLQSAHPDCDFVCHGQDDRLCIAFVGACDVQALLAFVTRQLGLHRSAIHCEAITEIPRLGNGKIDYTALYSSTSL